MARASGFVYKPVMSRGLVSNVAVSVSAKIAYSLAGLGRLPSQSERTTQVPPLCRNLAEVYIAR